MSTINSRTTTRITSAVLLMFCGVALAPPASAQRANPGDLDAGGRVYSKIVVKVAAEGSAARPVEGLPLFVVRENGDKVELTTGANGTAAAWLVPAEYRIVSREPTRRGNSAISWDLIASIRAGTSEIELTDRNAQTVHGTDRQAASEAAPQAQLGVETAALSKRATTPSPSGASGSAKSATNAVSEVAPRTGRVVRWEAGAANTDQIFYNGLRVRLLVDMGIAVAASVVRTDDLMWVNVSVANGSTERIHVDPSQFVLRQTVPKHATMKYRKPADVAKSIGRRANIGAALMVIAGEMARTETNTEISETSSTPVRGRSTTYGSVGNAPVSGSTRSQYEISGRSTTYIRTTEQDHAARARAADAAEKMTSTAAAKASVVLGRALRANTVWPEQNVGGVVFFERDKKAHEFLLVIPFGETVFELPLVID